eukprot:gnl/MRDRNA2_/MRDRNA2_16871_c0_seq1.p1 gnl/MRDRNA2_/MRDRNA2_16871_c0~~gnl/MRDRNA2_/MRDRNA2_16871_c0_seq1.p1  ORF type:complete len:148 (+),score=24.33 gnl/MRDRNA2_/MRDRNA2_16871_c0_seq1:84-527(+)
MSGRPDQRIGQFESDLQSGAGTLHHVETAEKTAPLPGVDPDMFQAMVNMFNSHLDANGIVDVNAIAAQVQGLSPTLLTAAAFTSAEDFANKFLSYPGSSAYQSKTMNIVCPEGVAPGQQIEVKTSAGPVLVAVPDGVAPGQEFQLQL